MSSSATTAEKHQIRNPEGRSKRKKKDTSRPKACDRIPGTKNSSMCCFCSRRRLVAVLFSCPQDITSHACCAPIQDRKEAKTPKQVLKMKKCRCKNAIKPRDMSPPPTAQPAPPYPVSFGCCCKHEPRPRRLARPNPLPCPFPNDMPLSRQRTKTTSQQKHQVAYF